MHKFHNCLAAFKCLVLLLISTLGFTKTPHTDFNDFSLYDTTYENTCLGKHELFQALPSVRPLTLRKLGDRPQFTQLIGLKEPNQFFETLKGLLQNPDVSKGDKKELENLFQAVGYSGVEDPSFTIENISPTDFPNGISGIIGNEKHDYRYAVIAYKDARPSVPGWKIEAKDGCDFYFLSACGNAFNPFMVNDPCPDIPCGDQVAVSVKNADSKTVHFDLINEQTVEIPIFCKNPAETRSPDSIDVEYLTATRKLLGKQDFQLRLDIGAIGETNYQAGIDTLLGTNCNANDQVQINLANGTLSDVDWNDIKVKMEPVQGYIELACGTCKKEKYLRYNAGTTFLTPSKSSEMNQVNFGRLFTFGMGYETPSLGKKCKDWTLAFDLQYGFQKNDDVITMPDNPIQPRAVNGHYLGIGATVNYYVKDSLQIGGGVSLLQGIHFSSEGGKVEQTGNWTGIHFEVTKYWGRNGYFLRLGAVSQSYRDLNQINVMGQVGVKVSIKARADRVIFGS